MKKIFYSNGKLLLTSEYVVLDGAKALALPTKMGQSLEIEAGFDQQIRWTSFDFDGSIWFEEVLLFSEIIQNQKTEVETIKSLLINVLYQAFLKNDTFLTQSNGYLIQTKLGFPKNWGLGTSSTLINNLAQWLDIDAYELLQNSFGGSGYDIACAQNNYPILFQIIENKPFVEKIIFKPSFSKHIYFVYLNQKQSSRAAIVAYRNKQQDLSDFLPVFDAISTDILKTKQLHDFEFIIQKHEAIMSQLLEMDTAKERLFSDFEGVIKSLGAWGGDFVMVVSNKNPTTYFKQKGFQTILTFDEMVM